MLQSITYYLIKSVVSAYILHYADLAIWPKKPYNMYSPCSGVKVRNQRLFHYFLYCGKLSGHVRLDFWKPFGIQV